jgi:hypothetical protein
MSLMETIAEKKIRQAQREGAFDNLPGAGKPLALEDDSAVPEDLRLIYKVLKNANCLPPEISLHREILQMRDLLRTIVDDEERLRQFRKINLCITRLNLMRNKPIQLEIAQVWQPNPDGVPFAH